MGIRGLLPFLKDHGSIMEPFEANQFPENCAVAIDVPIFAHKFIYTERTIENLKKRFLKFAETLKEDYKVRPIFVFDGVKKLDLKAEECIKRGILRARQQELVQERTTKLLQATLDSIDAMGFQITDEAMNDSSASAANSASEVFFEGIMLPTKKDYADLRQLLEDEGHRTYQATHEAEAYCAFLTTTGQAWCTITEDTDTLAFGSTRTIFKFGSEAPVIVEQSKLLEGLQLSLDQFVDLCCMFGCDFCHNVAKIGPKTAYKLMLKHGSWPNIIGTCFDGWPPATKDSAKVFDEKFSTVKECFQTFAFQQNGCSW